MRDECAHSFTEAGHILMCDDSPGTACAKLDSQLVKS